MNSKIGSGLMSDAYVLNEKYIQLIGKREDAFHVYSEMKENADLLEGKITCVDYPHNMKLIEPNKNYPYGSIIYPIVQGKSLDVSKITNEDMEKIAKKIVEFNKEMHTAEIHWDRNFSINHELEKIRKNLDLLKQYFSNEEITFLNNYEKTFAKYIKSKKQFCITHCDLWSDNLIVDENNNLVGIVDFGNMCYFLPEADYATMWNMADGFLDKLIKFSDEDITKESVDLFILHRELCTFEYILKVKPKDLKLQLGKIRKAMAIVKDDKNILINGENVWMNVK